MRKTVLLAFILAMPFVCAAQFVDSVKLALKQKPKFFLQFDSYNSIVTGSKANAPGIKIGLDYGKKIRFGVGYFKLNTDVVEKFYNLKGEGDTVRAELSSHYFTVGAEYVLFRKGPWQISVPAHIGLGSSYFQYPDSVYGEQKIHRKGIVLFEPAITGHYKIIKWVGVGFGVGYRLMLKNNPEVDDNFNSPLYVIRLKIFFDEIYKSIFKPEKKKDK